MSFTDASGNKWENVLDYAAITRVNNLTGVRLLRDPVPTIFDKLADPVVLIEVLYAINRPAIDAAGLTPEQFGPLCLVDQNPIFVDLMEQLKDFFRQLGHARKLASLVEMMNKSQELFALVSDPAIEKAERELMDAKFAKIKRELEAKLSTGNETRPTPTSLSGDSLE